MPLEKPSKDAGEERAQIKLLKKKNEKLLLRALKAESDNEDLRLELAVLKKNIVKRAHEMFLEHVGKVMGRAKSARVAKAKTTGEGHAD